VESQQPDPVFDCEMAHRRLRAFVDGSASRRDQLRLRAHLANCPACELTYREFVEAAATLTRGVRTSEYSTSTAADRAMDEAATPRARPNLIAADRYRKLRLSKWFLPILAGCALIALSRSKSVEPVRLTALSGVVQRGAELVPAGGDPIDVMRGSAWSVAAGGRVRLNHEHDSLTIEGPASFLIDRTDQLAVRLFEARARIDGSAVLLTPVGAIETHDCAGLIALDAKALELSNEHGVMAIIDGSGKQSIAAGHAWHVDLEAALAQRE
jgi:hypothetical protein